MIKRYISCHQAYSQSMYVALYMTTVVSNVSSSLGGVPMHADHIIVT